MSTWRGIEAESEGLAHAWSNLRGDSAAMADYTYDRMSAYVGASHPAVCKELLQRIIGLISCGTALSSDEIDPAAENADTFLDGLMVECCTVTLDVEFPDGTHEVDIDESLWGIQAAMKESVESIRASCKIPLGIEIYCRAKDSEEP